MLSASTDFVDTGKGRLGNHLAKIENGNVPLVRTTSKYDKPVQRFDDVHISIANRISQMVDIDLAVEKETLSFNNALIEIYDKNYFKMKYHSDQALDLDSESYIALFSCYERPEELSPTFMRRLKVKHKVTNQEYEFMLENNSVILFSTLTNTNYQHKIILDASSNKKDILPDNKWLGITFRQSKTWVRFKEGIPYFPEGEQLRLADENQQREFYKLRGQENKSMDFEYPNIHYTLSPGDCMEPK